MRREKQKVTYVAFTSSLAGTGGIPEAIVGCIVACSGALFGGDFLRVRNFIVGTAVSQTSGLFSNCYGRCCRWCRWRKDFY
jgi:hypothetical protein